MKTALSTYQYGSPRQSNEGLRLGVARQVPRGVRREDWQRKNYFDVWLPLVAPTADLVAQFKHGRINFAAFTRHYKVQMKTTESRQVIELLAAITFSQPISIGCFCADESLCHRSVLKGLILQEVRKKAACLPYKADKSIKAWRA
jgi:uncharacterized protein YeaO (DUF488 family)